MQMVGSIYAKEIVFEDNFIFHFQNEDKFEAHFFQNIGSTLVW
jgi:hypothetical protein